MLRLSAGPFITHICAAFVVQLSICVQSCCGLEVGVCVIIRLRLVDLELRQDKL